MTTRQVERWLAGHGFRLQAGRKTSHRQWKGQAPCPSLMGLCYHCGYQGQPHGTVSITIPGHDRDLSKKHLGMIVRRLSAAGFKLVREELARA